MRYRVIYQPWRNWAYWVQVRKRYLCFWWWEDVKDFENETLAVERAKLMAADGRVVFDTGLEAKPGAEQ
jgi:hypothetical protein